MYILTKSFEILQVDKFPIILEDTLFVRLWYKKDDEFLVPKAKMIFAFFRYVLSNRERYVAAIIEYVILKYF